MTAESADQASPEEVGFQLLADQLPDLIILAFDPELRMWAATGGGLRGHGWSTQDFVGLRLPEIAGSSRAEAIEACARAALGGECTELEMNGYEDPAQLWALTFVPLADPAGAVSGGMALCRDVTEQRRAERLLRAREHQLAEAQRIAQVGSWEWDLATDELTFSDELCRIFGLAPGFRVPIEPGVEPLIYPADLERVKRQLGRMRAGADPAPFAFEHRIVRTDGTVRTVMAHSEGVVDERGQVVRFIGTDQDITERRRADAERRRLLNRVYEAQEGQDRRLAADLHDGHVQSLAAIGFKLEQARLRLGASGSPEVDELLWQVTKDLCAEVTSLRRTIGRLRPLVLVEDGLEAALREEAKSACNRAALVSCEVTSELDGRLDPVVETALFRVAQQALANVVDHASATHAVVAIEGSAKGVTLRVSDDGCGFDPDHVQVLADIAHFGLIAMRERVEALNGRFRVITAPGEGTVVEAKLPPTDPIERWET
ncbi:MAG TPA: PAS domain-containing protein [Actinomycetes bacterium]|nr:PAS domain-containing protein [Actinomycetes bacterium]